MYRYLGTIVLFSVMSLALGCGKQSPPNFGVPVFKPPEEESEENHTIQKEDTLVREERSATGRYRNRNYFPYEDDDEDNQVESSHNNIDGKIKREGKTEAKLLRVIHAALSTSRLHNKPTLNKHRTHESVKPESGLGESEVQSKNLIKRTKLDERRSSSQEKLLKLQTLRRAGRSADNDDAYTRGWNAAAVVTGFLLVVAVLLGVTYSVRCVK